MIFPVQHPFMLSPPPGNSSPSCLVEVKQNNFTAYKICVLLLLWNLWQKFRWQRAEHSGVTMPCFGEIKPCQFSRTWVYSNSMSSFQLSILKKATSYTSQHKLKFFSKCVLELFLTSKWETAMLKPEHIYNRRKMFCLLKFSLLKIFFRMKNLLYF